MPNYHSPLRNLKVASPCPAEWNAMTGNSRVRFCGQCQLNVYNLSGMSQTEAEQLLTQSEGRLCVRYYQRADGTVLTQNCPVGGRAARQRGSRWATAAFASLLSFVSGVGLVSGLREKPEPQRLMGAMVAPPEREPTIMGDVATPEIMGKVAPVRPIMGMPLPPKAIKGNRR